MANFKRKRNRRTVKCTLCTPFAWMGNHRGRSKPKYEAASKAFKEEEKL